MVWLMSTSRHSSLMASRVSTEASPSPLSVSSSTVACTLVSTTPPSFTPERMLSFSSSPSPLPNNMAHCSTPARASILSRLVDKSKSPSCLSECNLNLSAASEEHFQNTPLTSQVGRDMTVGQLPACQADFNASLSQELAPSSSTPQQKTSIASPSSMISPASTASHISEKSSFIPTLSQNSSREGHAKAEVKATGSAKKEAESSVHKRKFSESDFVQDFKIDNEVASKTKDIKPDTNLNINPIDDSDGQFLPGAVGRYDAFLEDVYPDMKLKTLKFKKVRCVLCGDGRVFSYCNIGRHIKAVHEPPVTCEICQKEFNVVQLIDPWKWHKDELAEENNNVVNSDIKVTNVKPRREAPPSVTPHVVATVKTPTTQPVKIPTSRPVKIPTSRPVSSKYTRSEVPDHCGKSDLSTSNPAVLTKVSLPVPPPSQVQAKLVAGDLVSLIMSSVTVKGVSLKIGLEKDAKVKKAMKKFGKRFNVEYKSLKFFQGNTELSGGEVVKDLDGSGVLVFGEFAN